jgi:hypothetical protein
MAPKYETLQSIVDQLEFCDFTTRDTLHDLKMNAAFVALKEKAAAESGGSKTATPPNMPIMPVCPKCKDTGYLSPSGQSVRADEHCPGWEYCTCSRGKPA